ncbi:hypothetical protein [Anaerotignum sp.]|uniref:hypothetical protein n=1 Tax=Anaerotignum sp. TaxID=2039241 RepID=UPI002ED3AC29
MKMADYSKGRNDGLALALKIVKEGGIEALEQEVKFRGVTNIHTSLAQKDLNLALEPIKQMTLDTVLALSLLTLRDEFDMGRVRMERFMKRFSDKAGCIMGDFSSWQDIVATIQKETGIEIVIRYNS